VKINLQITATKKQTRLTAVMAAASVSLFALQFINNGRLCSIDVRSLSLPGHNTSNMTLLCWTLALSVWSKPDGSTQCFNTVRLATVIS